MRAACPVVLGREGERESGRGGWEGGGGREGGKEGRGREGGGRERASEEGVEEGMEEERGGKDGREGFSPTAVIILNHLFETLQMSKVVIN